MVYRRFMSSLLQYCSTKTDLHSSLRLFVYSCVQKPKSTISNVCQRTLSQLKFYKHNYKQYQGQWWSHREYLTHHRNFNWSRFTAGRFNIKNQFLFASAVGSFSWENDGIQNEELNQLVDEVAILHLGEQTECRHLPTIEKTKLPENWQNILDEPMIKIWKVVNKETGSILYKILGRNCDVTAMDFFIVQTNIDYRKKWDKLVIEIDIIDESPTKCQQVLRWISAYPYPLSPREYIYVRRPKVIPEKKLFAICSRAVQHPKCKLRKNVVRVPVYVSHMVIKPHKSEMEPGMDFILTYSDEPQTPVSNRLASYITSNAIPEFLKKVYAASKQMPEMYRESTDKEEVRDNNKKDEIEVKPIPICPIPTIDNSGDRDKHKHGDSHEHNCEEFLITCSPIDEDDDDDADDGFDCHEDHNHNAACKHQYPKITPTSSSVPLINNIITGDKSPPPLR